MAPDILQFWRRPQIDGLRDRERFVHPVDREVIDRIKHRFDLKCLPSPFTGPLLTAPVVLLYLNPGLSPQDRREPKIKAGRGYYLSKLRGREPLCTEEHHLKALKWWTSRTTFLSSDTELIRRKVAIIEIGAYHSKNLANTSALAALPSSRLMLDWAQTILFKQAIQGQRVVICLRAARFWGLDAGKSGRRYGEGLFVPIVTRGGYVANGKMKREIIAAVRKVL